MKKITGTVSYIELEGGFWGIETSNEKYFPLHMHEQLKVPGKKISCRIRIVDVMTLQNWGIPCEIIAFDTF